MNDWSPLLYARFEDERTRAARDLLAQVPLVRPARVVDVGCGPGNSTALLAERYPKAQIVGLDTSPAMLEAARRRQPGTRFEIADAGVWTPGPDIDLVFANATYQWVQGHLARLPLVLEALRPGAVLAVQMPDNIGEPSHLAMREAAMAGPWARRLAHAARDPLPAPRLYYDALRRHGARVEIWRTIYNHPLADAAAIVEWVRGTGLRPFLEPLVGEERDAFLADYLARIAAAYPPAADGRVLLAFPRLFIVATR